MLKKIKIIIDGMIMPFLLYYAITFLFIVVYMFIGVFGGTIDVNNVKDVNVVNVVLVQGLSSIFIIAVLVPLYLHFKKKYEIYTSKFSIKRALYVVPLAFSVCIICNVLLQDIPSASDNIVSKHIEAMIKSHGVIIAILMSSVLIPIVEELLFRGFMYGSASLLGGAVFAIAFTSTFFGIVHLNLVQGIYGVVAGIFLGYVRYKYDSVLYTIIMHLAMNACSIIFVPTVLMIKDINGKAFMIFICAALMIASLYKVRLEANSYDESSEYDLTDDINNEN